MRYYEVRCNNPRHKRTAVLHGGALLTWLNRHEQCGGRWAWGSPVNGYDDHDAVVDYYAELARLYGEVGSSD